VKLIDSSTSKFTGYTPRWEYVFLVNASIRKFAKSLLTKLVEVLLIAVAILLVEALTNSRKMYVAYALSLLLVATLIDSILRK